MNSSDRDIERLYREEGARLWWSLLASTGDREVASDAAAEAFAQALARGGAIRDPQAWVWRAAFRIAAGEMKRRGTQTNAIPEVVHDDPEPSYLFDRLSKLSRRQREAVVLFHYADLPLTRIAEILGMNKATVSVHLVRGRARIRAMLEADDG